MPKLPKSRQLPIPSGYAERLARWRDEWLLEQRLRLSDPSYATPLPFGSSHAYARDALWRKLATPSEPAVAPEEGQIRILRGWLVPRSRRQVFVAVLRRWENGTLLVAPFGPFLEPATTTELSTDRSHPALSVLSLWNTRSIEATALADGSYFVDFLTPTELADARTVFRHAVTGDGLPAPLWDRVGSPIVHPRDPRIEYQSEEARSLAFATEATATNVITLEELPLAAGSTGVTPVDFVATVPTVGVLVWVHTSASGERAFAEVFEAQTNGEFGARSAKLDGTALVDAASGNVLARITRGEAEFVRPPEAVRLLLMDATEKVLPWRRQRKKP